ncbi:H-type small acid-soluble spore protein [Oceanobacillus senegalensis]|uniref:H-type small acid-soluble spore protein n=1 Tax=Oceanobacillus senegalensis TaxID=1936063 RepID=UPI000A30B67F|nr:H-type small acid-soluble spore protein [Oceanobacillus senegalensis]
MDRNKAKQIAQSNKLIPVTYKGRSVVIKQVDEQQDIARVFPLDNLNSELSVELSLLDVES